MKSFAAPILLALGLAATTLAQAVSVGIAPTGTAPDGCKPTFSGNFTIGTLTLSAKARRAADTQDAANAPVVVTLKDGILTDSLDRTGSIVANHQFQFDGPPQAGSIYTGGWTVCQNDSLAMGSSTVFYRCLSGNFYNLYDESVGDQCQEINIVITPTDTQSSSSSSSMLSTSTQSASSSGSTSASGSGSSSFSRPTAVSSISLPHGANGTIFAGSTSISGSVRTVFPTTTGAGATAASKSGSGSASSTGGALPTRVPKRETFGAVVGILGAAFFL